MAIREVLLLGNPQLYESSTPVERDELDQLESKITNLHDTLSYLKKKYGGGRAIAAPQIGVQKRLIYVYIDKPLVIINPALINKSTDMMEVWDDCLCFPDLLVKVHRHNTCTLTFRDMNWKECTMDLKGDLSELLQHEYDHLDGILAVSRAIDEHSFALNSQRELLRYSS